MISFESVSLDIDSTPIFSDLTLSIQKNEKLLILGRSGIGKTSLFRLLLGFQQPRSGKILVNGLCLQKDPIHQIRQHIFYLSQDIDLMNDTILRLLTEIWESNFHRQLPLEEMHTHLAFLELSPNILQKQTQDLSGGERQRLGLLIGLHISQRLKMHSAFQSYPVILFLQEKFRVTCPPQDGQRLCCGGFFCREPSVQP